MTGKEKMFSVDMKEITEQYLAVIEAIPQSEKYSLDKSSLGSIAFWLDHLAHSDMNWKDTLSSILASWKELEGDPLKIDLDLLDRIVEVVNEDKGDEPEFSYRNLFNMQIKIKNEAVSAGTLSRVSCGGLPVDLWPRWFLEVSSIE